MKCILTMYSFDINIVVIFSLQFKLDLCKLNNINTVLAQFLHDNYPLTARQQLSLIVFPNSSDFPRVHPGDDPPAPCCCPPRGAAA